MSNLQDEKFWEMVREGEEEIRYQDHLTGACGIENSNCSYCERDAKAAGEFPIDEYGEWKEMQ